METLLREYKRLKAQLTENVGYEKTMDEVGWNDSILEAIDNLLKDVPTNIAQGIRLNHFK
jgi:hypothetical protein